VKRFGFGLTTLLGLSFLLWVGFKWLQIEPLSAPSVAGKPDIILERGVIQHYDQGALVWRLQAQHTQVDERSGETVASQVDIQFFQEGQNTSMLEVTAQKVTRTFNGNLVFEGTLEAKDAQGLQFQTQNARWVDRDQVLEGSQAVRVVRPNLKGTNVSVEAEGFRYDVGAGKISLWSTQDKVKFTLEFEGER